MGAIHALCLEPNAIKLDPNTINVTLYQGPTNISQVLSPFSASPPKVLLSGFRSRCHIVVKGVFPKPRVQQGLDQLIFFVHSCWISQGGTPSHLQSHFDSASEP